MKNSGKRLQFADLVLIFELMPALLLLSAHSAARSITNSRMRGTSSPGIYLFLVYEMSQFQLDFRI
jgi:hypothetical protein